MADLLDEFGVGQEKDLLDEFGAAPSGDLLSEFGVDTTAGAREEGRFRVLSSLPTAFVEGGRQSIDQSRFQFHERYGEHYGKTADIIRRMGAEDWTPSDKETMESNNPLLDQYVLRMKDAISKGKSRQEAAAEILPELQEGAAIFSARAGTSRQEAEAHGRNIQEATPKDPSFLEQAAISAAASAPSTAVGLAAGLVGGPAAGAVVGGLTGGVAATGSSYMEATQASEQKGLNLEPEQKAKIALVDGLLESVGEGLSLRVALKAGVPFFRRLVETIGAEASSEAITSLMQDANKAATIDPDMTLRDFAYNAALSATAGAMMGGAVSTVVGAGQSLGERLGRQKDDERAIDDLLKNPEEKPLTTEELLATQPETVGEPETDLEQQLRASLKPDEGRTLEQDFRLTLAQDPKRAADIADTVVAQAHEFSPGQIASQMWQSGELTIEQFRAFRQELARRTAERQAQVAGPEMESLQQEKTQLSEELRRFAEKNDYTPTQAEMEELDYAKQILQEVKDLQLFDEQQVVEHVYKRLYERPTWLSQMYGDMLGGGNFYSTGNYDGWDYQKSVTEGSPLAPAEFFLVMAQRQAQGYYPVAGSVGTGGSVKTREAVQQLTWETHDGRTVDFDNIGPSMVIMRAADTAQMRPYAQLLEKWTRELKSGIRFALVDRQNVEMLVPGSTAPTTRGSANYLGGDLGLIFLDPTLDETRAVTTLAHEFGHLITTKFYQGQPKHVRDAVEKAWARQAMKLAKMNVRVDAAMSLRRGLANVDEDQQNMRDAVLTRPYVRGYLLSFDEWMAHQMEKVAQGGKLGMGKHIQAFFAKAAAKLRDFFNRAAHDLPTETTFENFLRLGVLARREQSLARQNLSAIEKSLQQYGIEEIGDLDLSRIDDSLNKTLGNIKMQAGLAEAVRGASPELKQRAVKAVNRIGQRETALLTPQLDGPEVGVSAEDWVSGIEDAYLPGQPKDVVKGLLSGKAPSYSTEMGTRLGSVLTHAVRSVRGQHPKDTSPYKGDLDKFGRYRKAWFTLEQFARMNPHIEQVQRYVRKIREWSADRMAWMSRADGRLRQWRKLSGTDQKILGRYLLDQSADGTFLDLNDPAIRRKYPMSQAAVDLYGQINQDFQDFLAATEATLVQQIAKRLVKNPMAAAAEIQRINAKFAEIRKQPYFPLSRFGKYIVTVRATGPMVVRGRTYQDGEVVHLEAFDTRLAQIAEFERIKKAYPNAETKMDQVGENTASLAGMPTLLVEALKHNPDIGLSEQQKKAIDEYMAKIAPGQSFVKNLVKRKTVEGYTEDVMRAYANYFFHGASHLARIKHVQSLNDEIRALEITADLITGDSTKRRAIQNYMTQHFEYIMRPENDWAALRGAVAVSYLGAVPKAALVNLTQVPLVTYPHLAARYGDVRSTAALLGAYKDSLAMYHVTKPLSKTEEEALTRWAQGQPALPGDEKIVQKWGKFTTEEAAMLRKAVQETWIDESIAMELAAMSEGSWLTRFKTTSRAGYYARTTSHYAMIPFQAAEKLNRRVTALAAFRLAKRSGATFDQAFEAAREAVSASQYEYAKWNRPEMLRGKKGVVFMFWQYMLNTLYFAFGGDKGWWRWWLVMLASAGVSGLPFAEDLMNLATWIANKLGDENKPANVKYSVKKATRELEEMIGLKPDLLLHGMSRYGFGLLPFADISGSLSMGRVVPGSEMLAQSQPNWQATVAKGVEEAGGATASLVMRMIQAATGGDMDLLTRIEKGMPITIGQKLIQAFKAYDRRAIETRGGADIVEFDPTDPWHMAEIIGMAAGFPAKRVNDERESFYMAQDFVRFYQTRRQILLSAVDHAYEHGDAADRKEAIDAIRRYNKSVPSRSLVITRDQIVGSRRTRERGRGRLEGGGHQQPMYNKLFKDVREGNY